MHEKPNVFDIFKRLKVEKESGHHIQCLKTYREDALISATFNDFAAFMRSKGN